MQRFITYQRFKGMILCVLFIITLLPGVAFCYAGNKFGIDVFGIIGMDFLKVNFILLLISSVYWAFKNKLHKGVRYAWRHYILVLRLRRQLLDAKICTELNFGASKIVKPPGITVSFGSDLKTGTVYIKNSIAFHDKLGRLDISSSLGMYVVEQIYLTDNENDYRYDFYDASLERRRVFDSLASFKAYSALFNPYELFVDNYTHLPLTHQLLVGQTGSGKSYALHGYILQMLMKPVKYHLYFADLKNSTIAVMGGIISPADTADSVAGIVAVLEKFVAEMEKRQAQMKKHLTLSHKLDGDYRDFGLSPHIFIFDEYADFVQKLQEEDKKLRDHAGRMISDIVLKGRQLGCFIWIGMQQAGSNNIPTFIRDNLPWKVVLGNAEPQTYVTAFGAGADIPQRKMEIGEGVYTYPSVANKPKLCSFPTLNFDIVEALENLL